MMPVFSWRGCAIILATIAMMAAVQSAYLRGGRHVQALWDAEKVVQLHAAYEAEAENRRMETKRQTGVINAQNAQVTRNAVLQTDADRANSVVTRLRDTLDAGISKLPGESATAASQYAATAAKLFLACGEALTDSSRHADGHASDSLMLQQAWPQ